MAANAPISHHYFYTNATAITDAENDFNVTSNASEMTLIFDCTGTFQARLSGGVINKDKMLPYPCIKYPKFEVVSDVITDGSSMYIVNLSAIDYLRVELLSLTGSITVYGKAVG